MVGDELVERADPVQALRETTARQLLAVLVHQMDVVMILRPIVTHEHCHRFSLRSVRARAREPPAAT